MNDTTLQNEGCARRMLGELSSDPRYRRPSYVSSLQISLVTSSLQVSPITITTIQITTIINWLSPCLAQPSSIPLSAISRMFPLMTTKSPPPSTLRQRSIQCACLVGSLSSVNCGFSWNCLDYTLTLFSNSARSFGQQSFCARSEGYDRQHQGVFSLDAYSYLKTLAHLVV